MGFSERPEEPGALARARLTSSRNSHHLVKLYPGNPKYEDDIDEEPFIVHRDFATCYSPVLKAAFESRFVEGEKLEYRFDKDFDGNVIRILSQWFYTQKVDVANVRKSDSAASPSINPETEPSTDIDLFYLQCDCLIKLWVLADQLLIPKLQNMTIDTLEVLSDDQLRLPTPSCKWVYENTAKESPLRNWFVCQFAFRYERNSYFVNADEFPREMLIEMLALRSKIGFDRDERDVWEDMEKYQVPEK